MRYLSTLLGVALLAGAALAYWTFVPRDAGDLLDVLPEATAPATKVVAAPTATLPAEEPTEVLVRGPALLTPANGALTAPVPVPPPVRLRIPSLGVDASILALGVEENGQMQVPDDVREVGWYRYGPAPGEQGSAVLAAHVDSRTQGPGVFFRLGTLRPGDVVEVESGSGGLERFVVQAVSTIDKDQLPVERIFARDGDPTLTLVTCGGSFSAAQRSYDSNVVVVATPEA